MILRFVQFLIIIGLLALVVITVQCTSSTVAELSTIQTPVWDTVISKDAEDHGAGRYNHTDWIVIVTTADGKTVARHVEYSQWKPLKAGDTLLTWNTSVRSNPFSR